MILPKCFSLFLARTFFSFVSTFDTRIGCCRSGWLVTWGENLFGPLGSCPCATCCQLLHKVGTTENLRIGVIFLFVCVCVCCWLACFCLHFHCAGYFVGVVAYYCAKTTNRSCGAFPPSSLVSAALQSHISSSAAKLYKPYIFHLLTEALYAHVLKFFLNLIRGIFFLFCFSTSIMQELSLAALSEHILCVVLWCHVIASWLYAHFWHTLWSFLVLNSTPPPHFYFALLRRAPTG